MPDGSSSMRSMKKTGVGCPVFWRQIGTPFAFLVVGWPLLLLLFLVVIIVANIPNQIAFSRILSSVYFLVGGLLFIYTIFVWPLHAIIWWVRFGMAVRRGFANRRAWLLCGLLGLVNGAFVLFAAFNSPAIRFVL